MKKLFEPVTLNHLALKNRLVRSARWEGIAAPDGGIPAEGYAIYEELAKGGVGAIITGFTSVAANDVYFGGMMRLSDDRLIPQYKKLVEIIHREGCPVIAQLALGAFYRPSGEQAEPNEMTADEIQTVIRWFADAAARAKAAGFDGVQIHAAHFFFLSRFVSPRVNRRTDEYGGSTENRARILLEILRGVRSVAPDLHITAKINSDDFTPGGLTENESLAVCELLAGTGIDSIEVSGNGTSVSGIRPHVNEAYFAPFAARLAEKFSVPVILVGGLRSRATMERVLNDTKIELLSLSRPLLHEPDFPRKLESGESDVSKCVSCNACYSSPLHRCIFRKEAAR
ncbi:MAG: NADH:flavin oxidoreductase [Schwartzia sp.]|nr:NADH:flavin oxidoreductase [Schwartzia sp. (in: firmicutes)]